MLINRYYLIATWDGIWKLDPIPSHGMGASPHIPYHPISFRPLIVRDSLNLENFLFTRNRFVDSKSILFNFKFSTLCESRGTNVERVCLHVTLSFIELVLQEVKPKMLELGLQLMFQGFEKSPLRSRSLLLPPHPSYSHARWIFHLQQHPDRAIIHSFKHPSPRLLIALPHHRLRHDPVFAEQARNYSHELYLCEFLARTISLSI